ncbi:MAG: serine/threonine protein kinase [Acidobacteria bacterium]|nr:serine/threonine protein kinase [Acidobacteriota bacterium]
MADQQHDEWQVLGSRFSIIEALDAVNQTRRYVAKQHLQHHDSMVMLKVFAAAGADQPSELLGFLLTAHAAAKLSHPHIASSRKPEQLQGLHFCVSDYPQNAESLQRRLHRQGWLEVEEVLDIASQIADALHYAHQAAVLHLNLQPENLWLDGDGNITLTDFGVPRKPLRPWLYEKRAQESTLVYRSPELLNHSAPDERSDLYSLGILLYEILTDMLPFAARDEAELCLKIALQKAPAVQLIRPDLPAALAAVIARLMAENPAVRFQNAAALQAELAAIREGNLLAINLLPDDAPIAPIHDDGEESQPLAALFDEDHEFLVYDFNRDSAASPLFFKTTDEEPSLTDERHADRDDTDSLSSAAALPLGVDSSIDSLDSLDSCVAASVVAQPTAANDEALSLSASSIPPEAFRAADEAPLSAVTGEAAPGQSWLSVALLALGVAMLTAFSVLAYKGYFTAAKDAPPAAAANPEAVFSTPPAAQTAASAPVQLPDQAAEGAASSDAKTADKAAPTVSEAPISAPPKAKPDTAKLREQLRQSNLRHTKKHHVRKSLSKAPALKARPRRGFFRWRFW